MWKHVSYIQKGISHERSHTKCQDSVTVREDEYCIVAALADGLGSLKHSEVASAAATNAVWQCLSALGRNKLSLAEKSDRLEFQEQLVNKVSGAVKATAKANDLSPRDMDCTLAFVYISKVHHYAIVGLLGDSAICVIKEDGSLTLSDGNRSANGTHAILDKDAEKNMDLSVWDIHKQKVLGFILTSDGLDNEIYMKNSPHVYKAAQDYFNCLVTSREPAELIRRKIGELTNYPDTAFDDDISIAVVSRAKEALVFPEDPSWLCTCGARNRLQDTYCAACSKDFSVLYRSVRFREHGGKTAFFQELNRHPKEEEKLLLQISSAAAKTGANVKAPSAGVPEKKGEAATTAGNAQKKWKLPVIVGAACLVVGAIIGSLLTGAGLQGKIDTLAQQAEELTLELQRLSQQSSQVTEPDATQETLPQDYHVLSNGDCFWGTLTEGVPSGQGVLLTDGYYYIGRFEEGRKNGEFVVTSAENSEDTVNITYLDDVPVQSQQTDPTDSTDPTENTDPTDSTDPVENTDPTVEGETEPEEEEKLLVRYSDVSLRQGPGTDYDEITLLEAGAAVLRTGTDPVTVGNEQWVEIRWKEVTGWVVSENLAPLD